MDFPQSPNSAVDVTMDFGAAKIVDSVSIDWEHPPLVSRGILCMRENICCYDAYLFDSDLAYTTHSRAPTHIAKTNVPFTFRIARLLART